MNLKLVNVTEDNFWDVVKLKSDEDQVKRIQIFERWVGSNTFFMAASYVYGFISRVIYDGDELVGFASHGLNKESGRHEMVSLMIGYQFQGRGYGVPALKLVIDEMVQMYQCKEIYLSVIRDNERAIRVYEKMGFKPTGEVEQGHHPEPIYCLKV